MKRRIKCGLNYLNTEAPVIVSGSNGAYQINNGVSATDWRTINAYLISHAIQVR